MGRGRTRHVRRRRNGVAIALFHGELDLTAVAPFYPYVAGYDSARGGGRFAPRSIIGRYLTQARAFGIGAVRVMISGFIRIVRTW